MSEGDLSNTQRIVDIKLDERTILWRNADIEQERRVAIFDLLEGNSFKPLGPYDDGYAGPYKIVHGGRGGAADRRRRANRRYAA